MLSRVTTRVIIHSAKNRFFIGTAPSKYRTIFSGTRNQQNYESEHIASPITPPAFQSDNKYWQVQIQGLSEGQIKLTAEVVKLKSQIDALVRKLSNRGASKEWNIVPQPHVKDVAGHIRKIFLEFPRQHFGDLDDLIRSGSSENLFSDENHVEADLGVSPTLLKLLRDVASELALFHKWGIAHGNLNPQNILLLKRERLFAKLADPGCGRGILDWETPEQLIGGRHSAAGDMFNFGCVLFFCISRGAHPFGESSDERHQNIKENKMELCRINCFPEVSRLLSNLLNPDPKIRLSAIEVLNYPLFWSPKKRLAFIYEASECISLQNRALWKEIENIMPIATGAKSDAKVGDINVSCGFNEFPSLFHCIGDLVKSYIHIIEVNGKYEPSNDGLKPLERRLDSYLRQVPFLFIHLYEIIYKHCKNEGWFSKFFHKL